LRAGSREKSNNHLVFIRELNVQEARVTGVAQGTMNYLIMQGQKMNWWQKSRAGEI
jgi:hypothetical protein